jgi:lipid-binding SYLF domain-containing protein
MRVFILSLILAMCVGIQGCATAPKTQSQVDEQRAAIQSIANQTLNQLYQQYPDAQSEVRTAAGYAVFSDTGLKFMFGGGAHGQGVAVNNATNQATYMKMIELQPGFGFGAENFRIVFIFNTQSAFDQFVTSGWEFGANAMAAVKSSTQGGGGQMGTTVSPGVMMYQLTEKGVIVGISITGAKYYRNDSLN